MTARVDVVVVDPTDASAYDPWFAVVVASGADLWPEHPGWGYDELRQKALGSGSERLVLLAARQGTATVGAAWVELPERDNRHLATFELHVDPPARRRGHASALVGALEALAVAEGRHTALCRQDEPRALAGRSPGRAFAVVCGYHLAQVEVRRDLPVPLDPDLLERLETSVRPRAQGYDVVSWSGACPERFVADRAAMGAAMATDTPAGGVELGPEDWDPERVRRAEDLAARQGRLVLTAAARHRASGRLVGFTELQVPRGAPELAYQCETLVLAEHRGHGLGLLMKVANVARLAEASPATRWVTTTNAADNGPMVAINEALGCVVTGEKLAWQKHLGARR